MQESRRPKRTARPKRDTDFMCAVVGSSTDYLCQSEDDIFVTAKISAQAGWRERIRGNPQGVATIPWERDSSCGGAILYNKPTRADLAVNSF